MTAAPDRPAIVWFRRDLRVDDHAALSQAIATHPAVVPLFVLDDALLAGRWAAPNRIWWMLGAVHALDRDLRAAGAPLVVRRGRPAEVVPALAAELGARDVYVSRDLAPYGRARDAAVVRALGGLGGELHELPGIVIHEPEAVATSDGRPFVAFAPFRRAWQRLPVRLPSAAPARIPTIERQSDGRGLDPGRLPDDASLGAVLIADPAVVPEPGGSAARSRLESWLSGGSVGLDGYADRRDRLDLDGSSRLSADLRWGTLSPTEVLVRADRAGPGAERFAAELCWRDFYAHVLWHHPRLRSEAFDARLDTVRWRDDADGVAAWRSGRTGYPVVDASMRQLAAEGWMPNRARMIAASFLVKDLLVDWRVGERHFMEQLIDGDVASNNGGWQWVASTGPDAQPSFRILNPVLQGQRFDPDGAYVRRWVPELANVPAARIHQPSRLSSDEQRAAGCVIGVDYPAPIVDHASARARAIEAYSAARRASQPPVSVRRTS